MKKVNFFGIFTALLSLMLLGNDRPKASFAVLAIYMLVMLIITLLKRNQKRALKAKEIAKEKALEKEKQDKKAKEIAKEKALEKEKQDKKAKEIANALHISYLSKYPAQGMLMAGVLIAYFPDEEFFTDNSLSLNDEVYCTQWELIFQVVEVTDKDVRDLKAKRETPYKWKLYVK